MSVFLFCTGSRTRTDHSLKLFAYETNPMPSLVIPLSIELGAGLKPTISALQVRRIVIYAYPAV